ncbi:MAG: APC family permease [Dethiobacteria bacterium]|jgi:APA family basic amino acid/polyamine antiporter
MQSNILENESSGVQSLSKELAPKDFFAIGFGAMIGVGWVLVIGDWINLGGGPIAAIIAFLIGSLMLIPIALVYGELTTMMPVAGGSIAFTLNAFGPSVSYFTGWFLVFGYVMLCPWEAIAIGEIFGTLFPALRQLPLYTIGDYTIYAPVLIISLIVSILIIGANLKGIQYVVKIQNALTKGIVMIAAVGVTISFIFGSVENIMPIVSQTPDNMSGSLVAGILSVLAITPFFYSGFDTIPQEAEESSETINYKLLGKVIGLAVIAAGIFYVLMLVATSFAMQWQKVIDLSMPSAEVYGIGLGFPLIEKAILVGALCGLISTLNSFFVAGARVLLALGRARLLPSLFSTIHPKFKTPYYANYFIATLTIAGPFFGKSLLVPIINVCSLGFMLAWLSVCCSAVKLRRSRPDVNRPYKMPGGIKMGYLAIFLSFLMIIVLVLPASPGALVWPLEWGIVLIWFITGLLLYLLSGKQRKSISENERCKLVFGNFK